MTFSIITQISRLRLFNVK